MMIGGFCVSISSYSAMIQLG